MCYRVALIRNIDVKVGLISTSTLDFVCERIALTKNIDVDVGLCV